MEQTQTFKMESMLEEISQLRKEVEELKKDRLHISWSIPDDEAKMRIQTLIKQMKEEGIKKIDMLDIITKLNLPVEQVEKVMTKLEKENLVIEEE